jgi:hypothetical protein
MGNNIKVDPRQTLCEDVTWSQVDLYTVQWLAVELKARNRQVLQNRSRRHSYRHFVRLLSAVGTERVL